MYRVAVCTAIIADLPILERPKLQYGTAKLLLMKSNIMYFV